MNHLFREGLLKADEVRMGLGLSMYEPINIFDACMKLGLTVRFIDVNMEGMYVNQKHGANPTILISTLRPLSRRCYTCAHELGHHVFGHGTKLDALSDPDASKAVNDNEEFLVDCFAGSLLMPVAGIQAEFAKRRWNMINVSPLEYYIISSIFGTGYQSLVSHCKWNKLISESKASSLLKFTPIKILKSLLGHNTNTASFKIVDSFSQSPIIDIEVSSYILLPENMCIQGDHLQKYKDCSAGTAYLATKPGIIRVFQPDNGESSFIRIQNANYVGLAENRHLENEIN